MSDRIDHLLTETRRFAPPEALAGASATSAALYEQASEDRLGFWAEQARQLQWEKPFTEVLDWQPPHAKWFHDGTLNVAVNCLDRHVEAGNGDRVAFHWEGSPTPT